MIQHKERRFSARRIAIVGLIYSINLYAIAVSYVNRSEGVSLLGAWRESVSRQTSIQVHELLIGFVFGELGCLSLWLVLSSRRTINKTTVYLVALVQLILLLVWLQQAVSDNQPFADEFVFFPGMAIFVLLLIALYMRLSSRRAYLVSRSVSGGNAKAGITVSQGIFLITLLAVVLGMRSNGLLRGYVLHGFIVGSVVSMLSIAGLTIAISIRNTFLKITACLITLVAIAIVYTASLNPYTNSISLLSLMWSILLPVLWVGGLKWFGYEIRYFDRARREVIEHPFHVDDAAKEPRR